METSVPDTKSELKAQDKTDNKPAMNPTAAVQPARPANESTALNTTQQNPLRLSAEAITQPNPNVGGQQSLTKSALTAPVRSTAPVELRSA